MQVLIVGAGFTGAVIARYLAEHDHHVIVIDERSHIAGNCFTKEDPKTGIMVHTYGPHIFHTDDEEVWDYVNRFGEMMPYRNQVKATVDGRVYSLPINLHTINQLYGKAMSPVEAQEFISKEARGDIADPISFEDQALKFVGDKIYKAFFYGYTKKQWGREPSELPASILKRLPLRFNYNDNYFSHRFQGIPKDGYTKIVEGILDHRKIELRLNTKSEELDQNFDHTIYTGPLDRWFDFRSGRLAYRTLRFEEFHETGDYQGTAVMNYCDAEVPFTRITEHKHFAPWTSDQFDKTVCYREFSGECGINDIPYYPVRLVGDKTMLEDYVQAANQLEKVTFAGRLGTYSYLDMDVSIRRALETAESLQEQWQAGATGAVFSHSPI